MSDTPVTLATLLQDNSHLELGIQELEGGRSILFFKPRPQPKRGVRMPYNYQPGGRADLGDWIRGIAHQAWYYEDKARNGQ